MSLQCQPCVFAISRKKILTRVILSTGQFGRDVPGQDNYFAAHRSRLFWVLITKLVKHTNKGGIFTVHWTVPALTSALRCQAPASTAVPWDMEHEETAIAYTAVCGG